MALIHKHVILLQFKFFKTVLIYLFIDLFPINLIVYVTYITVAIETVLVTKVPAIHAPIISNVTSFP